MQNYFCVHPSLRRFRALCAAATIALGGVFGAVPDAAAQTFEPDDVVIGADRPVGEMIDGQALSERINADVQRALKESGAPLGSVDGSPRPAPTDRAADEDAATSQTGAATEAKSKIDGDVEINTHVQSVETTARNAPDGAPSTAETCIGSIGGAGADVQITGNVVVNRTGATNECECDSPGAACESKPAD